MIPQQPRGTPPTLHPWLDIYKGRRIEKIVSVGVCAVTFEGMYGVNLQSVILYMCCLTCSRNLYIEPDLRLPMIPV